MTILASDLKILASKVMDDVPEGGSGPTGVVIQDGANNAVFTDITGVDRTGGDVSIRQLHGQVQTDDTGRALDAHMLITAPPDDAAVDIVAVPCEPFATRTQIAAALSSYLIPASERGGCLLEDHPVGLNVITLFQRPGTELPAVGQTLHLVWSEGLVNERRQAVRAMRVEARIGTFTDTSVMPPVDFQALLVTVTIDQTLQFAFPGSPPSRGFERKPGATRVRDSRPGNSRVFGAGLLTRPTGVADDTIRVDSVFAQVVPSSYTPRPVNGEAPGAQRTIVLQTAPRRIEAGVTPHARRIRVTESNASTAYVLPVLSPRPEPGTVSIVWRSLGTKYTIVDDGNGNLVGAVGEAGLIQYASGTGSVGLPSPPDVGSAITIHYGERVAFTNRSNQGAQVKPPQYVIVLDGGPSGTEQVVGASTASYLSGNQVRNVTISDSGVLSGDATGYLSLSTRTLLIRPTYMPDPGSQFQFDYQIAQVATETFASPPLDDLGFAHLTLLQEPAPGSCVVRWATRVNANGSSAHELALSLSRSLSDTGYWALDTEWRWIALSGGATYTASATIVDGVPYRYARIEHRATDDAVGQFVGGMGGVNAAGRKVALHAQRGMFIAPLYKWDYVRAADFEAGTIAGTTGGAGEQRGGIYGSIGVQESLLPDAVSVTYQVAGSSAAPQSMTFDVPDVQIDLCPYTSDTIVAGSVQFVWMGTTYIDDAGRLYRDRTGNSPGIECGTLDYRAGIARISSYVVNGTPTAFTLQSLWTRRANWTTASYTAQTLGAPLQPGPGGFNLQVLDAAGELITVNVDLDGVLSGPHARGRVEFQTGDYDLQFGDYVLDSALTPEQKTEWWYDPADVQGGKIWRPWPVDPTTLRTNYVARDYLPIDEATIRMSATTLPPDGRVPKYWIGGYVAISRADRLAPAHYAAGGSIDTGRNRLALIRLLNAAGKPVTTGYTTDLDAGTVQVVDTTGWVQPVTVEHWLSRMFKVSSVRLDGTLRLNRAVAHEFPAGAVVSSVMMFGDLHARVQRVFDQATWDQITWSDAVIGNVAPNTYNDADYPIQVTNRGALTERFALVFRSNGIDFDCIGEHIGYVGLGNKNTLFAPLNPRTNVPYFSMPAAGWGAANWTPGNVVFVHTVGAMASYALVRSVQPSEAPQAVDFSFGHQIRFDVDRAPSN